MRRPTILIVDGVKVFRDAQAVVLESRENDVLCANGPEEAMARAAEGPIDVALVDLGLEFPGQVPEASAELCRKLKEKSIYCVLVTADGTSGDCIARWRRDEYIDHHQSKANDALRCLQEIEDIVTRDLHTNFVLEVTFDGQKATHDHWRALVSLMKQSQATDQEVSQLFHRLFPPYISSVDIQQSSGEEKGASGSGVVWATTRHRESGLPECVIVKYGGKRRVRAEEESFNHFVAPLGPRGVAPKRWSTNTANLTAIAYWPVRPVPWGKCPTLAEYLRRGECAPRHAAYIFSAVFREICQPWYHAFGQQVNETRDDSNSLPEYWLRSLWRDRDRQGAWDKLIRISQELRPNGDQPRETDKENAELESFFSDVRFLDPVQFLIDNIDSPKWPRTGRLCVTHGDLHGRNIFVVGQDPCLIDFGDTGWGHPFRDFVSLEVSLRVGALYDYSVPQRLCESWELESRLADPASSDHRVSEQLERAAYVTSLVRKEAEPLRDSVPQWQVHYATALLFALLKHAGVKGWFADTSNDRNRRRLAYLAAGAVARNCSELLTQEK